MRQVFHLNTCLHRLLLNGFVALLNLPCCFLTQQLRLLTDSFKVDFFRHKFHIAFNFRGGQHMHLAGCRLEEVPTGTELHCTLLDAFLGLNLGIVVIADAAEEPVTREIVVSAIQELNLADIRPNPFQPRTEFDEEALSELAASIKAIGIVQPITVRAVEEGKYEIIAGERRFRASKLAGLSTIPAYIRKTEDDSLLELALIENIQREDLNAIEVAISYQRLIDECNLTQDGLSERVGKKRATIANYLRLLKLPAQIQLAVRDKKISMGHARAILGVEDPDTQLMIFEQILEYDFSVRKVEEIVRELVHPQVEEPAEAPVVEDKPKKSNEIGDYIELQKHLSRRFDTKVELKRNESGKGKIIIGFKSDAELEKIIELLDKIE